MAKSGGMFANVGAGLITAAILGVVGGAGVGWWGHVSAGWPPAAMLPMGLLTMGGILGVPAALHYWWNRDHPQPTEASTIVNNYPATTKDLIDYFTTEKQRELVEQAQGYQHSISQLQIHASAMATQIGSLNQRVASLTQELEDTRPEAHAMTEREAAVSAREIAIQKREEAERYNAAVMKAAAVGRVDRMGQLERENADLRAKLGL